MSDQLNRDVLKGVFKTSLVINFIIKLYLKFKELNNFMTINL